MAYLQLNTNKHLIIRYNYNIQSYPQMTQKKKSEQIYPSSIRQRITWNQLRSNIMKKIATLSKMHQCETVSDNIPHCTVQGHIPYQVWQRNSKQSVDSCKEKQVWICKSARPRQSNHLVWIDSKNTLAFTDNMKTHLPPWSNRQWQRWSSTRGKAQFMQWGNKPEAIMSNHCYQVKFWKIQYLAYTIVRFCPPLRLQNGRKGR
jgi:hypothetical protein